MVCPCIICGRPDADLYTPGDSVASLPQGIAPTLINYFNPKLPAGEVYKHYIAAYKQGPDYTFQEEAQCKIGWLHHLNDDHDESVWEEEKTQKKLFGCASLLHRAVQCKAGCPQSALHVLLLNQS